MTTTVSKIGPLTASKRSYVVRVTTEKIYSDSAIAFPETVSRYEVLNAAGEILFAEDFPVKTDKMGFEESFSLEAYELHGTGGEGIIMFRDVVPAAPMSGRSFRILGPRGAGLVPIPEWVTVYGTINPLAVAGPLGLRLHPGDVIMISVWTGWFGVVVPVTVDWAKGIVNVPIGCRTYPVETEKPFFDEDAKEAHLYSSPAADSGYALIKVSHSSKVEYINAHISSSLGGKGNWREVGVDDIPWLRIRVDGKEGWVRDAEDLMAVGLRPAG